VKAAKTRLREGQAWLVVTRRGSSAPSVRYHMITSVARDHVQFMSWYFPDLNRFYNRLEFRSRDGAGQGYLKSDLAIGREVLQVSLRHLKSVTGWDGK